MTILLAEEVATEKLSGQFNVLSLMFSPMVPLYPVTH